MPTLQRVIIEPIAREDAAPDRKITGKITFQELLDWGVTQAANEQVLGGPMPVPSTVIRDFYSAKAQEFSSAKSALQVLVDQIK